MTAHDRLPLLFLDVDGPLIPFGPTPPQLPGGRPLYPAPPGLPGAGTNPLLDRIDPALGPRLAALPCTLLWATTWGEDANLCVAPRLGLPALPVLDEPEDDGPDDDGPGADPARGARLHWKTRPIVDRAAGRPFAWVDDEISAADRVHVAAHHPGPALLHRVDPARGLTDADLEAIGAWLQTA
ncbi:hypothetical protein [Kitasatospora paranensis]|uniref:Secreted protein n=1 Tax=Kitasatospora paranensis TaxID=258053 RepID=A0ABW2G3P9_9ACTN